MAVTQLQSVNDKVVQPVIESTKSVFSMMLGCDVELISDDSESTGKRDCDISGIIGFSGSIHGTVVISLSRRVAFGITECLLGVKPSEVNDEIRDLVGEMANMIGGNAKERLSDTQILLGLPTVITGSGHEVNFEPGSQIQRLCFASPWGQFNIELAMRTPK